MDDAKLVDAAVARITQLTKEESDAMAELLRPIVAKVVAMDVKNAPMGDAEKQARVKLRLGAIMAVLGDVYAHIPEPWMNEVKLYSDRFKQEYAPLFPCPGCRKDGREGAKAPGDDVGARPTPEQAKEVIDQVKRAAAVSGLQVGNVQIVGAVRAIPFASSSKPRKPN